MSQFKQKITISHAHTVVWEYCKDDRQSQWGMAKFDPQPTLDPEPIVTKLETRDYVRDIFFPPKLGSICPGDFAPIYPKCTPKTFECLLHFFLVLPSPYREGCWTDICAYYVIQRGSAQGSAFCGWEKFISKFDRFIRKIRKIYNGAYGEILTKF